LKFVPNGGQREFITLLEHGKKVTVLSTGNGFGKTTILINAIANLISPHKNKWFDSDWFNNWRNPKRVRIVSHPRHIADDGRIQDCINEWFPKEALKKENTRHDKQGYRHLINYNGWEISIMSKDVGQTGFAGKEVGFIAFDEPFPRGIFSENVSRTRKGGQVVLTLTPVTDASAEASEVAWIYDDLVQGGKYGAVHMFGGFESNCIQHGHPGFIEHSEFEATLEGVSEEEYEARAFGRFQSIGGLVHKSWADYRSPGKFPKGHNHAGESYAGILMDPYDIRNDPKRAWFGFDTQPPVLYMCLDPHHVKPFAMIWFAQFPDGHGEIIHEWPSGCFGNHYHQMKRATQTIQDYINIIDEIEEQWKPLKIYKRFIDRSYAGQESVRDNTRSSIWQDLTQLSGGRLQFLPNPGGRKPWKEARHVLRGLLTPTVPQFVPKWRCWRSCTNVDHAMRHYLIDARSGRSADKHGGEMEKPQDRHKCLPNCLEWVSLEKPQWRDTRPRKRPAPRPQTEYQRVAGVM